MTILNPNVITMEFTTLKNIKNEDKKALEHLITYFAEGKDQDLSSKSFLFFGPAGVGKTMLTENIAKEINKDTIYMSCGHLNLKDARKAESLKELKDWVDEKSEQVIIIDDIGFIFDREDGDVHAKDKRNFMAILNMVNASKDKILIVTTNHMSDFEEQMIDRIEVKILFNLPDDDSKKAFITDKFKKYIEPKDIDYIAKNTMGYNYRDLKEMIRLSWRLGGDKMTTDSLKKALRIYKPTELYDYDIHTSIDTTLKDIIGKEPAVKILKRLLILKDDAALKKSLGIKRDNLLLFYGPPGTGKTFMARAMAGELGIPLINIDGSKLFSGDIILRLIHITEFAKNHKNCIIFIDEADKLFGNELFGEDNSVLGVLQGALESIDLKEIKATIIISANRINRFGYAFRDRFIQIPFSLPSLKERQNFCEVKAESANGKITHDIDIKYLASETKGMSFRELDRIWNELIYYVLENKKTVTKDVITDIIDTSKDEPENNMFG
ncbi:MAG: ATP-binding protein [DPANN group archaeon]|nr:ATP-binding protein [DPANN group archaeon]